MPATDPFFRYRPGFRHIDDEGSDQPARPSRAPNRFGARLFGAKAGQKLRDRHTVLELDLVAGHQGSLSSGELRLRARWLTGRAC
jgi:hypothetical protein